MVIIDPFPHVGADDFADDPGVLAGGGQRRGDAAGVVGLPGQVVLHRLAVRLARHVVDAADDQQRLPLLFERDVEVEQQGLVDVEDAGGVLGALEVAAHPEAVFGDARDHWPFSITQVSLLPPPWLELTTSEPFDQGRARQAAGQHPGRLAADDVRPQIDVPGRQPLVGPGGAGGQRDHRLGDVVARVGPDLVAELGPLRGAGRAPSACRSRPTR